MRRVLARHLAFWAAALIALSTFSITAPTAASAASATSQVWCSNTFAPTVNFNLPMTLETWVDPEAVAAGDSFDVEVQATIPLSEGFIEGVLAQVPTLTEVTVNRVFIAVDAPSNAVGPDLDIEFSPGTVAITTSPGVPIPGGAVLTSPIVTGTFTATGPAGSSATFELDPAAAGSPAAVEAGGTVWGGGGVEAAIELDLTILGVVKVGFNCTDGALTQTAGPDGELGTGDDVFAPPVIDNPPFLVVPIEEGSTSSSSSSSSSSTSSSSTSSSSTSSSTTSTSTTTSTTTISTTTPETTTTVAPTQTYLPAGSVNAAYTCVGADADTDTLLNGLGDGEIALAVVLSSAPIVSPVSGEQFDLPLRWALTLDQSVIDTAAGLGITSIQISDQRYVAGAGPGLSGPDFTARPPARSIPIGAGPASFTEGPFDAPFTRTSALGEPITVAAKNVALVATIDLGGPVPLRLACTPDAAASFSIADVEGEVPPDDGATTTTALAAESVDEPEVLAGTESAQSAETLPRTGLDLLWPILLALALIDLGYLASSITKPESRQSPT